MLPGFRFLFAAIVLSMSILIFGLGAAALLRAAHEEFASNPSWRAAPEVKFAQPAEATGPVLAMLRVDTSASEKVQDDAPATTAPAEQAAVPSAPAEPERIAALKPEEASPTEIAKADTTKTEVVKAETAKAEIPVAESPLASEAAPAPAEISAPGDETRVAAIATGEVPLQENQAGGTPSEPMVAQVSPGADIAATKIATLGGPPVSIATPPTKLRDAKPDQSALKNRQQARRAAQRRRVAARARVATQVPVQPVGLFSQPTPAVRTR